jgi:hypothetical protein
MPVSEFIEDATRIANRELVYWPEKEYSIFPATTATFVRNR